MIVAEFALFWMVFGLHYLIAVVFDLVVVLFVILEGRVARQDAPIHSETATLEGAEAMLVPPEPAGQLRQDLEELRGQLVVHLWIFLAHLRQRPQDLLEGREELVVCQQNGSSRKFLDLPYRPSNLLLLEKGALEEEVDGCRYVVLILSCIETNELDGLAPVPEAEEAELLAEGRIEVVSPEVVVEGPAEGVVVVVARNGVIAEVGPFFLDLVDLGRYPFEFLGEASVVDVSQVQDDSRVLVIDQLVQQVHGVDFSSAPIS